LPPKARAGFPPLRDDSAARPLWERPLTPRNRRVCLLVGQAGLDTRQPPDRCPCRTRDYARSAPSEGLTRTGVRLPTPPYKSKEEMERLTCSLCGKEFDRRTGEVNRQRRRGRTRFFCSTSCAARHGNAKKKKARLVEKACPCCGKTFTTSTRRRSATFCSRSCASRSSVTPGRREGARKGGLRASGNLCSPEETLRKREAWKYENLRQELSRRGVDHTFEYRLGDFVYDLFLHSHKTLVEFDGNDHLYPSAGEKDTGKSMYAVGRGFRVVRVQVQSRAAVPIDPVIAIL